MRPATRVGLLVVIASMSACGGAKQPSALPDSTSGSEPPASTDHASEDSDPSATTQVVEQTDLGWIFEAPFVPTDVDVVLDTSSHAESLISVEGGTMSATGADGTTYSLEIPPDALASETTIGMTPVSDISGMPFGGEQTYSVQFSPEGLFFYKVAILTITPAEPIALDEQIVFGYQADGKDVILAAPVVDSTEIKIQVQHFSGNGVTKGTLAELDPAQKRRGADAESRLRDAVSAELIRIHNTGGDAPDVAAAFEAALAEFEEQLVRPLVAAAGATCAEGQAAIRAVYRHNNIRQQLLLSDDGGDALNNYPGLLEKATQVCVVEEFELCVEEHIVHRMLGVWQQFEHQFLILGRGGTAENAVLREARDLTVKCLTFKLGFESTGSENTPDGGGYQSTVTSEITLRFDPDERIIKGEAPLVNEEFEWFVPVCDATGVRGGGTFVALSLEILDEPDDQYGHVSDLKLTYHPGNTSESATITCPGGPPVTIPPGVYWTGVFVGTHFDEAVATGYLAEKWEIAPGDEHVGTKEWVEQIDDFSEEGSFELYHTPGE